MNRTQLTAMLLATLAVAGIVAPTIAAADTTAPLTDTAAPQPIADAEGTGSTIARKEAPKENGDEAGSPEQAPELPEKSKNNTNPKVASGLLTGTSERPDSFGLQGTKQQSGETVLVRAQPGETPGVIKTAKSQGEVLSRDGRRIVVRLPRTAIPELARTDGVGFVRPTMPRRTYGHVTSDGVETMSATTVQNRSITGESVTVAVVDFAFNTSNPEIADNVVGTKEFNSSYSNPFQTDNSTYAHGTATTELVVDTAPNASVVTIAVGSTTSMVNAMQWIANNSSIDVVSMSVGPPAGYPLDGTSKLSQEMTNVVESGKLFYMSAGNEANGDHWHGEWQSSNDEYLNFTAEDELMTVGTGYVELYVQWNDWPQTNEDYDVYLVNESEAVVASSTTIQNGSQPPFESISYNGSDSETYQLVIKSVDANNSSTITVFAGPVTSLRPYTNESSLVVPATSNKVTAVAALDEYDESIQPFSSQGPTLDGRRKPRLSAPDNVSTTAYAPRLFPGTSAAAPHAAGTVALLLDATNGSLTPSKATQILTETATPVTGTEPNAESGYGLVNITAAVNTATTPVASNAIAVDLNGGNVTADDDIKINVTATDAGGDLKSVIANASAFGAGNVTLDDPDGDTVYNATVTVNASAAAPDDEHAIPITAVDQAGSTNSTETNTLQLNINDPPVAHNDSYATDENTTLSVDAPGVLGNDSYPDDAALNATKARSPTNGSVSIAANGSFEYTPESGFTGTDSFTYNATDGNRTDTATVTINVTAANEPTTDTSQSPLSGLPGQFDDDGDGDITAAELGDAVGQFASNQLTAAELGEVVSAYASD